MVVGVVGTKTGGNVAVVGIIVDSVVFVIGVGVTVWVVGEGDKGKEVVGSEGALGVDIGVSGTTGVCSEAVIVTAAFGLQPGSIIDIRIRAIRTPYFMIATGLLVSDTL